MAASCGKKVEHWFKVSSEGTAVIAVACGSHVDVDVGVAVMTVLLGKKSGTATATVSLRRPTKAVLEKELICGSKTEGRVAWE
jgi:hypothetical protein